MQTRRLIACLVAAVTLPMPPGLAAQDVKVGLSIGVDASGFLNPVVNRIAITAVTPDSQAAKAGIVSGDEIVSIQGKAVKGTPASELKPYLSFNPGEARALVLMRANGERYEATLMKPKPKP